MVRIISGLFLSSLLLGILNYRLDVKETGMRNIIKVLYSLHSHRVLSFPKTYEMLWEQIRHLGISNTQIYFHFKNEEINLKIFRFSCSPALPVILSPY
jgi:hypothetical protein